MAKKIKTKRHSLLKKIMIPLVGVMLFQSVFFFLATFFGGVSTTINQNAEDVLTERVINQAKNVETNFSTQWANFSTTAERIGNVYKNVEQTAKKPVYTSENLQKKVLAQTSDVLIHMLRTNEVTGVFLILNDSKSYTELKDGTTQEKYGLCVRDYSPLSEYTKKEDLIVVRCPSSILSEVGCSMEAWWSAKFSFDNQMTGDYYYKPLKLAYENPTTDPMNLAYFDGVHNYGQGDRDVVSYSIPLLDANGYPYGVLGVELTTDYLKTMIPASTLYPDNTSCYALVQYQEGMNDYKVITYNGVLFQQCFGTDTSFQAGKRNDEILKDLKTKSMIDLTGSIREMQIYNQNTPFEQQRMALIGLVKNDALYGINRIVMRNIIIVSGIMLLTGCLLAYITSKRLTRPINKLSRKVRRMKGETKLQLERLNIDEIDDLVESIEELSDTVNKTAIRTEFFSRMSHDMRTPMNAIIGFSSPEILEDADSDELREYMDKVHSSGNFLLSLINEVLDMAKIETQRMELREEPTTWQIILDSIIPIIKEVSDEKNIHFIVDVDNESQKIYFLADHQRLSQILMNLLSNAVKFTPQGGSVRIELHNTEKTKTNVMTHIIVQDTGCGMSKEFQKKMFEPFSQEGKEEGGTGLGLAIAHQMLELMGGDMTCESEEGRGTIFEIDITNRIAIGREAAISHEKQKMLLGDECGKNMTGKRILLCEDHPLNVQIAVKLLERLGLKVENAQNGKIGLDMFETSAEGYYDLILMDIRMPEMNGLECCAAIRALARTDAKEIPIIAMTANAFKEDVQASKAVGMNEHLSKPIDPAILKRTLERFLV